jgi:ribose transport system permease protein
MKSALRKLVNGQQLGIVAIILVLVLVSGIINPFTVDPANIVEILRATAIYFIGACGATLLLVGGGLDLSIGSVFAVGAVAVGLLLNAGVSWPLAVVAALLISGVFGAINAIVIVLAKVPPFITTLGMYFAAIGIVTVVTGGVARYGFPDGFSNFGQLNLFGVPFLVYYAVVVGVVFHLLLNRTRFGYDVRAIGGNSAAALANGVGVKRVSMTLYVISAVVAGFCGILLAARVSTADPAGGGTSFTFLVLAAVIIGGTSLFGGIGSIAGTALGALLFSVINNVLALTHTNPLWQNVATGVILVAAVAFDQFRRSRQFVL